MRGEITRVYTSALWTLVERAHHTCAGIPNIQQCQLLSIKTGGCPEDCSYCPQSAHYATGVKRQALLSVDAVCTAALQAKAQGAERFCLGAAGREVHHGPDFDRVLLMIRSIRELGMEACCTLGMLDIAQARRLKEAGLTAYNHNLDTSRRYYPKIITTRGYDDRLKTIANVRQAGLQVCTGGILGMGESQDDRIDLLTELTTLKPHPESVTVNLLMPITGTPQASAKALPATELVRFIAAAKIFMPTSKIRLSAGRTRLSLAEQFLCFYAGANSIFLGEKLLTAPNPTLSSDQQMLEDFFVD